MRICAACSPRASASTTPSLAAEVLYAARDPFARKVMIDQGMQHDVEAGQPVVDHLGVIGQVTRVYPWLAEVTLITDKGHLVPVQNVRTGLRAVLAGTGDDGRLELRFIPLSADFQTGDQLVTSGIDGVYPPGLPVAEVTHVERNTAYLFADITCKPLAGVHAHTQVLVLGPLPATARTSGGNTGNGAAEEKEEILMSARPMSPAGDAAAGQTGLHRPHARCGAAHQPAAVVGCGVWIKPDFVALIVLYWCIEEPRKIGFLTAWRLGLLMDVADGSLFGQHALAYSILAYAGIVLHRRVQRFSMAPQILHVIPLLLFTDLVVLLVRALAGADFPGYAYFLGSFTGAALWPALSHLLKLPQRPRPDPDRV